MSTHNIGFYERKAILMSTHNIRFYEDLTKNIFELSSISSNTNLISSAANVIIPLLHDSPLY